MKKTLAVIIIAAALVSCGGGKTEAPVADTTHAAVDTAADTSATVTAVAAATATADAADDDAAVVAAVAVTPNTQLQMLCYTHAHAPAPFSSTGQLALPCYHDRVALYIFL